MALTPFSPLAEFATLANRVQRMIDEAFPPMRMADAAIRPWRPATDVWEDEHHLYVAVDLPGVKRESLDVQVTGDTLTIRGERQIERPEGASYLYLERAQGQFVRTFTLNVPVETDGVSAHFADGVLTVTLPKAQAVRPRKIEVLEGHNGR